MGIAMSVRTSTTRDRGRAAPGAGLICDSSSSVIRKVRNSAPSSVAVYLHALDSEILRSPTQDLSCEFFIVLDVLLALTLLDAVERRLRDEHFAARNQLLHVAEEKSQQQRANVGAVHIGVGHDDDLAVAQLGDLEIFSLPIPVPMAVIMARISSWQSILS